MSDRKVMMKLVAIADIHLKAGQEIDAEITVQENGIFTAEIAKDLVLMIGGSNKAIGRAAMAMQEDNPPASL